MDGSREDRPSHQLPINRAGGRGRRNNGTADRLTNRGANHYRDHLSLMASTGGLHDRELNFSTLRNGRDLVAVLEFAVE